MSKDFRGTLVLAELCQTTRICYGTNRCVSTLECIIRRRQHV